MTKDDWYGDWHTKAVAAFPVLIQQIHAAGPERAVENMERVFELLQSMHNEGVPQEWIDALQEDIGREVSPEIQRALAKAWRPERVDN